MSATTWFPGFVPGLATPWRDISRFGLALLDDLSTTARHVRAAGAGSDPHEDSSNSLLSGILQVGYPYLPEKPGSFYFAIHAGELFVDSGNSKTRAALGFGAGYRWQIGPGGTLRLEARTAHGSTTTRTSEEFAFALGRRALPLIPTTPASPA